MSVNCNPVISGLPVSITACECSLVSFTVNLKNVCNHSTFGIVANVIKHATGQSDVIVATVCKVVNTGGSGTDCLCIDNFPVEFKDIVIGECCEDVTLTVEAHGNYIKRCNA